MPSGHIVSKGQEDKFDIQLNYSSPDLDAGETIVSVTASVKPSGLILGTPGIQANNTSVYVEVSNGLPGKTYVVLFKTTTSAGRIYNNPDYDSILVKVIPL